MCLLDVCINANTFPAQNDQSLDVTVEVLMAIWGQEQDHWKSHQGPGEVRNFKIFSNLRLADYTVLVNEQLQKQLIHVHCAKFSFQELDRYFIYTE